MGALENQVAVITGAASGIDLEIARTFQREGASVLLVDCNKEKLEKAASELKKGSGCVASFVADVRDSKQVDVFVEEAVRQFGKLDILVNGAGIVCGSKFVDWKDEDWHRVFDIMVHGVFYGIRAAARQMIAQGHGGKIISISSAASVVPLGTSAGYCTAKAAVNMLTKVAAVELGKHNIRVNAIAPGETETPIIQHMLDTPGWKELVIRETPLRRFGRTTDTAEVALFLASDRSQWITGNVLFVDGGQGLRGVDYEDLLQSL